MTPFPDRFQTLPDAHRLRTLLDRRPDARPPKRSAGFDNLDAKLARIGYTPKALAERFDVHPWEIRRFRSGRLDLERAEELGAALRDAGIPT